MIYDGKDWNLTMKDDLIITGSFKRIELLYTHILLKKFIVILKCQ